MEIKPTGLPKQGARVAGDEKIAPKTGDKEFNVERPADSVQSIRPADARGLEGVRTEYTKADLRDRQKVDEIVTRSVDEIVGSWEQKAGPLPEESRRSAAKLMETDPIIRGKILHYLEKVLT